MACGVSAIFLFLYLDGETRDIDALSCAEKLTLFVVAALRLRVLRSLGWKRFVPMARATKILLVTLNYFHSSL
jgi:hypothetical protein